MSYIVATNACNLGWDMSYLVATNAKHLGTKRKERDKREDVHGAHARVEIKEKEAMNEHERANQKAKFGTNVYMNQTDVMDGSLSLAARGRPQGWAASSSSGNPHVDDPL